jgi:hypothetical protein
MEYMVERAVKTGLLLFMGLALLPGCAASGQGQTRPLAIQTDEAAAAFFDELASSGTAAQAYFTLFLPDRTVNRRYLLGFREQLEQALRRGAPKASMHYNATADRVFFLSRYRPEGWKTPEGGEAPGEILSKEFRNGTPAGWTVLNAFWSQFNRLLIGDDAWIQRLPESVRADLSHPLTYVVRAGVSLESNPDITTYVHRLTLELVEVGKERSVFSGSYPLVLSYSLP